ncbi:helix-turn-helix domain-containing protein [Micromonospora arborensis]|uniref:helix-turn-helix domain-containing protein n=1 Tax=Micromonospora arborensis TaxID=2116518 RepID=UPI0033DFD7A9
MSIETQPGVAPAEPATPVADQTVRHLESGELRALVDVAHDLAVSRDAEALLAVIARQGRRLLGAPVGFIATVSEEGPAITVRAADGFSADFGFEPCPAGAEPSGAAVLESSRPWSTPDIQDEAGASAGPALRALAQVEGVRAMIAVRLGQVRGSRPCRSATVLYLADRRARTFTENEHIQLVSFARLAGASMEKTRLLDVVIARLYGIEQQSARTAADLDRAQNLHLVHYELIDLAVARGDAQAFVDEAARHIGGIVQLCRADGVVVASSGGTVRRRPATGEHAAASGRKPVSLDDRTWVIPVLAGGHRLGSLVVETDALLSVPDCQELPLIGQAAAVLLRQQDGGSDALARRAVLDEMITTQRPSEGLVERSRKLGVDLDRPYVVLVLRPDGVSSYWAAAWAAGFAVRCSGLFTVHDDDLVLLLPSDTDPAVQARTIAEETGALFGRPVTVAASNSTTGPDAVAARYRQALRCLEVIIMMNFGGRGASVQELGFLPLLLAGRDGIDQFIDSVLRPVLDYDLRRRADLVRTLEAYFQAGGSPTNAAEHLHMHPNTVTRRLDRVKKLLGADWQDPSRALEIQLALRLHRLLTEL